MNGSPLELLYESAYQAIREKILRGGFPLGASLSRRKLAKMLGTSQLTVSVALRQLESDGLVETKARAGTRVRVPGPEDIRDSYILREALETQAARLFVKNATLEQRRELRRMAEHTDVLFNRCTGGETDPEFLYEVHSYHLEFHMRIAECGGSQALMRALEKNQVLIFNWLFDVAVHHQTRPPRSHRELIEVLCGADPEAADRAMRKHIQYGLEEIIGAVVARTSERWRDGAVGEIPAEQDTVSA
jgi:GntR family transcriptional regulator, rspAB operon transcriptional repressor